MTKRKSVESRSEIEKRVEGSERGLDEQLDVLSTKRDEVEVVRDAIEGLDFEGTAEGSENLREGMNDVEDASIEVFDEEGEKLDQIEAEGEEVEEELTETMEGDESDRGRLEGVESRLETNVTLNKIEAAIQTVVDDIEFLANQIAPLIEKIEDTGRTQDDLGNRVHKGRRGARHE